MFFERIGRLNLGMRHICFRGPGGGGAALNLASLSLPQQLETLKRMRAIPWKQVPLATQKHLVELLAKKAGVSVYQLTKVHYCGDYKPGKSTKPLIIDEIGKSLAGLYDVINRDPNRKGKNPCEYILEKLGFPAFDTLSPAEREQLGATRRTLPDDFASLPIEQQLDILKEMPTLPLKEIPLTTQRRLVELLAEQAGVSVYELKTVHYIGKRKGGIKPAIVIDAIGKNLTWLYRLIYSDPNRNGKNTCEYILEKLGFPAFDTLSPAEREQLGATRRTLPDDFASLPIEQQLDILKEMPTLPLKEIPLTTQRRLVELLAEQAEVSVYGIKTTHYIGERKGSKIIKPAIVIDAIGKSLHRLYESMSSDPNRNGKNICEYILEKLGFPAFDALSTAEREQLGATRRTLPDDFASLPIEQQLDILKEMPLIPWQDIPTPTKSHLVELLAKKAGVSVYQLTTIHYGGNNTRGKTIPPIIIDEIGKSLHGFYDTTKNDPNRKGKNPCKFILESLGYGSPPFNRVGRLFASSRAKHVSHSLFILLSKLRKLLRIYIACGGNLLRLFIKDIPSLVSKDPEYQGVTTALMGENIFSYSLIELICRALQHYTLDELGMEGSPNYLREQMFSSWALVHQIKPSKRSGSYQATLQTAEELPWLLKTLEKVKQAAVKDSEDEGFASLWLETQIKLLKIIITKNKLTPPLACALGKFNYSHMVMPLEKAEAEINDRLDEAQATAAKMMLNDANPLLVVHGPAGSGKTTLTLDAVEQMVRSGKKVLYVTPTHKAADVFMERFAATVKMRDLPAIRLASKKSIDDSKVSPVSKDFWVGDDQARRNFGEKKQKVQGALYVGTIAAGVRYVVDPPQATAGRIDTEYDIVIVDEASMAAKSEVYSILNFAKRAVLIGDHVQLEPFGLGRETAAQLGFNANQRERVERSLLEELMLADFAHVLLDTNYRAINPTMITLASRIFYDERISINHDSPYFTLPPEERRRQYPADSLKVVDTSGLPYVAKKEEKDFNSSYFNEQEAGLVVSEYKRYLAQGFKPEEIAVITPYRGQVNLIRSKLADELGIPSAVLQKWVSTFDSFQGDENKCVIVSFVRSNLKKPPETGFVGNYHRVNVGLTRAEERMTIIGDFATLKKTGNGHADQEVSGNLDQQTRHIFEEIEAEILELQEEGKALWATLAQI